MSNSPTATFGLDFVPPLHFTISSSCFAIGRYLGTRNRVWSWIGVSLIMHRTPTLNYVQLSCHRRPLHLALPSHHSDGICVDKALANFLASHSFTYQCATHASQQHSIQAVPAPRVNHNAAPPQQWQRSLQLGVSLHRIAPLYATHSSECTPLITYHSLLLWLMALQPRPRTQPRPC